MLEIYRITSKSTGKSYVGMTSTRVYGNGILISRAKKKYGKSDFDIEILAAVVNKKTADYFERFFISTLMTLTPEGYNIALGGDGGAIHTAEMKAKIAASNKARYAADPSIVIRISAKLKGRPSPNKGNVMSAESRSKISTSGKGRKHSDETKLKMSVSQKGVPKSAELIAKMKISAIARANTDEGKARMKTASLAALAKRKVAK